MRRSAPSHRRCDPFAAAGNRQRPPRYAGAIMNDSIKYALDETRIPKSWYNLMADLPSPPALVLHPGTLAPVGPSDLASLFALSLIMQEVSTEREIEIPEPVRAVYRQWRPSPLYRARRLEAAANTNPRLPRGRVEGDWCRLPRRIRSSLRAGLVLAPVLASTVATRCSSSGG
jgi:hypothetical protein